MFTEREDRGLRDPIVALLQADDPCVREAALAYIDRLRLAEYVDEVLVRIADEDLDVRQAAFQALHRLLPDPPVPVGLMPDGPAEQPAGGEAALAAPPSEFVPFSPPEMERRVAPLLRKAVEERRLGLATDLASLFARCASPESIPLVRWIYATVPGAYENIEYVGRSGEVEVIQPVNLKVWALNYLVDHGDASVAEDVVNSISRNRDDTLPYFVSAAAQLGLPEALDPLLRLLEENISVGVVDWVVGGLVHLDARRTRDWAVATLATTLLSSLPWPPCRSWSRPGAFR